MTTLDSPRPNVRRAASWPHPARAAGVAAVVFGGAIFGFFYAWVCSTMWGLDQADPRVAIESMQEMNASVRNGVFAPVFFGTPVVMLLAAALARRERCRPAAWCFTIAASLYLCGGLILTMVVNVPMNEDLAALSVPADPGLAAEIWGDYSGRWQVFNQIRALASGVSLTLAAVGLSFLGGRRLGTPAEGRREPR